MENPTPLSPWPGASSQLEPALQALDAKRLEYVRTVQVGYQAGAIVFGVVAIGCVVGYLRMHLSPIPSTLVLVFAACVWAAASSSAAQGNYARDFKALVMPPLVAQFGALSYNPIGGLGQDEFNRTCLFERCDRFGAEDLIEGFVGATRLRFCEVHAEKEHTTRDSEGKTQTSSSSIFKGLFFVFDFNKHFEGQTFVLPEGWVGSQGGVLQVFQRAGAPTAGRGQLVRLEDPDFERLFQVGSTDQIEARYILSTSLMRRFVELRTRHSCFISAAFLGGNLYLTLTRDASWFEAPPLHTALDANALAPILDQLRLTTGIVEELDLNTRIWSKQ